MLGKLSVPGRPTSLDDSRARAYCACSRGGWGLSILFSSPSLWETARYRLKYCLKGPLNPKQPTNQLFLKIHPSHYVSSTTCWRFWTFLYQIYFPFLTMPFCNIGYTSAYYTNSRDLDQSAHLRSIKLFTT